jgi:hypothetical protein
MRTRSGRERMQGRRCRRFGSLSYERAGRTAATNRVLTGSKAQCEQCNHTHADSQHRERYRIVFQPMQSLLHGVLSRHPEYARDQRNNSFWPCWVPCVGELGGKSSVCFGYEGVQAKAQKGSRYDGGCPNRRRSHTRVCNMAVAERQAPSSCDYR